MRSPKKLQLPPRTPDFLDVLLECSLKVLVAMCRRCKSSDVVATVTLRQMALAAGLTDHKAAGRAVKQLADLGLLVIVTGATAGQGGAGTYRVDYEGPSSGDDTLTDEAEDGAGNGVKLTPKAGNEWGTNGVENGVKLTPTSETTPYKSFLTYRGAEEDGAQTSDERAPATRLAAELGLAPNFNARTAARFKTIVETYGVEEVRAAILAAYRRKAEHGGPIGPGTGLLGWISSRLGAKAAETIQADAAKKKAAAVSSRRTLLS